MVFKNVKKFNKNRQGTRCARVDEGRKAFTLAEVLITLGIIGVVAAVTMPTLISKYKEQVMLTKLKKAYTELYTALRMASVDYGDCSTWEYGSAFDGDSAVKFLDKYIAPYLKLSKNCGKNSGCLSGGIYSLDGIYLSNYGDSDIKSARAVTASGYVITVTSGGYYVSFNLIFDDKKEKLVLGKNVFHEGGFCIPSGTLPSRENLKFDPKYGCSHVGGNTAGLNCLGMIIRDGWKFADDYPVKF